MLNNWIRTRFLWIPDRGDTDACFIEDTNDSADEFNFARLGSNQENEKSPTTELINFLSKKILDGK